MTTPRRRAHRAKVTVLLAVAALVVATTGCRDSGEGRTEPATTASTRLQPGASGAFAVADNPQDYEITSAYGDAKSDQTSIRYARDGDDDLPGWTVSAASWSEERFTFDDAVEMARERGRDEGVQEVEVHGRRAFLGPYTSDGQVIGRQVVWEERPGFLVRVDIFDGVEVDPVALAESTYEISEEAFEALQIGTNGGGVPGPRFEVVSGEVDGDPYVLTAVLPEGYPLEPIDRRAGCAELTYRGETASTCGSQWAFRPLDEGGQAVLGGVNFGFGVFRDGLAEVLIAPVETPSGPWEHAATGVAAEAPDLTFFVLSFQRVCDRVAVSKSRASQPLGVPAGYPRSKCD